MNSSYNLDYKFLDTDPKYLQSVPPTVDIVKNLYESILNLENYFSANIFTSSAKKIYTGSVDNYSALLDLKFKQYNWYFIEYIMRKNNFFNFDYPFYDILKRRTPSRVGQQLFDKVKMLIVSEIGRKSLDEAFMQTLDELPKIIIQMNRLADLNSELASLTGKIVNYEIGEKVSFQTLFDSNGNIAHYLIKISDEDGFDQNSTETGRKKTEDTLMQLITKKKLEIYPEIQIPNLPYSESQILNSEYSELEMPITSQYWFWIVISISALIVIAIIIIIIYKVMANREIPLELKAENIDVKLT